MPRMEPQKQARRDYTARMLNRANRNVNTSVAREVKALGVDGVRIPETLVAVTETLRKIAKLSFGCIAAIKHELRELRAPNLLQISGPRKSR